MSRSYAHAPTGDFALQLTNDTIESSYSSVALHPDGQILGTGTEQGIVHVWETRSQNVSYCQPWITVDVKGLSMPIIAGCRGVLTKT